MGTVRKLLSCILVGTLVVACATPVMADDIQVTLNGETLAFDVKPQIINDRTMVPLRAIFEALGATVDWNQDTKTILSQKDDRKVMLSIGKKSMSVNDNTVEIDTPAQIVENRTLVPVRAIAEAYDADVTWNADTKTVVIVDNTPNATVTPTSEKQAEYEYKAKTVAYYQGGGNLPRYDSVVDCGKEIKFDELESAYYYKYTSDADIQDYIEVAKLKGFNDFKEEDKIILARKPLDYISIEKADDVIKIVAKEMKTYDIVDSVDFGEIMGGIDWSGYSVVDGKNSRLDDPFYDWYSRTQSKSSYRLYQYFYYPQISLNELKEKMESFDFKYDYFDICGGDLHNILALYKDSEEYAVRIYNGPLTFRDTRGIIRDKCQCTMIQIIKPKK